jgi:hypothetical protein
VDLSRCEKPTSGLFSQCVTFSPPITSKIPYLGVTSQDKDVVSDCGVPSYKPLARPCRDFPDHLASRRDLEVAAGEKT